MSLCSPLLKSRAFAHGAPASVLGVARSDADGRPRVLRLSEGMALRTGSGFRYLCPARFESDATPRAAALSGGSTLVATLNAMFVLEDDGQITPHPAPWASAGTIRALDANADGVFALRDGDAGVDLLRLDAHVADVLASLSAEFTSLVAEDGGLLVAGLARDGRVLQRGFHPDGRERADWTAEAQAPPDAVAVLARLAAGQPYLVVLAGDGLVSELVRLDGAGQYRVVQRASVGISGPIASDAEHVSLAFDGQLAELRAQTVTTRMTDLPVTCLARAGVFTYACAGTELVALRDGALAERVFGLDELEPPDLAALEPALAERCTLQWLRFAVDLIGAGVEPRTRDDGDAGVSPDAGASRDAGEARDAGAKAAARGDGCTVRDSHGSASRAWGMACGLLLAARLFARGRRRRWASA